MPYFVGMDIHKRVLVYHVLDHDGASVDKGRAHCTTSSLKLWAQSMPEPWIGAMETTLFTHYVYDTVVPYAQRLVVGDSAKMRAMNPNKHHNDKLDALFFARLVRADLVPVVHTLTSQEYELREVLRFRALLVRESVRMHNKTAGLLMESGIPYEARRLRSTRYFNDLVGSIKDVPRLVADLLEQSHGLADLFQRMQKKVIKTLCSHPALRERVERLKRIRSVGDVTALTWALEIVTPHRFSSISKAISYCGLCVAEEESADRRWRGHLSPRCNMHLRTVLLEAAKLAPNHNEQLRQLYARELERHSSENLATIAVARKLAGWLLTADKKEDFAVS